MYLIRNCVLRNMAVYMTVLAASCDCHMTLIFCCQDYPSVGLVGKLLLQENVIPIFMITQNEEVTSIYNVSTPLLFHCALLDKLALVTNGEEVAMFAS